MRERLRRGRGHGARGWPEHERHARARSESASSICSFREGFPYQGTRAWYVTIRVRGGFVPLFVTGANDARYLGVHGQARARAMSTVAVVTSSPPFVEGGHLVIARALVTALRERRPHRRRRPDAAEPVRPSGGRVRGDLADRCRADRRRQERRSGDLAAVSELCGAAPAARVLVEPHDARVLRPLAGVPCAALEREPEEGERQRRLIQSADRYLLGRNVNKLFVQSETIRRRLSRWPEIRAEVLYPPPPPRPYRVDDYEPYLFAVSRFTRLKRMSLIVEALAQPEASGINAGPGGRRRGAVGRSGAHQGCRTRAASAAHGPTQRKRSGEPSGALPRRRVPAIR